jgi:hypothetical protein
MDKPRVKPLTFHTVGDGRMALSPVGPYRVLEQPDGYFDVMFDGCLVNRRKKGEAFTNCEAAEAWTQTRHEKQVLACIAALEPVTVQDALAVVEGYPAAEHGSLPTDPHECAKQVKAEILAAIRALAEKE